ncbi:MAG: acyl--CoA ligase [Maricaulaceae bacterium]|nr:acyl--CoA ligase [Maricaulaceae bacterium]
MSQRLPAPSRPELEAAILGVMKAEPLFAVGEAEVRGVKMPAFVNAPGDLRFLLHLCEQHGDKTAVVYEDMRWSFAELGLHARMIAGGLRAAYGVKKGDVVAIAMRNYPEWMAAFLGITALGAVAAPMNAWWTPAELAYALKDCGARIVIADAQRAERLKDIRDALGLTLISRRDNVPFADMTLPALQAEALKADRTPAEIHPDDPFAIFYTSGSTGEAKGAILTHRGATTAILSYALVGAAIKASTGGEDGPYGFQPVMLFALPLFHCTASHAIFMVSIVAGRTMVMMRKWSPEAAVELVEREGVTSFTGVPTMSHELMLAARAAGKALPTLRDIGSGGAKRPPAHVAQLGETFPQAWTSSGYGLTETNAVGTYIGLEDYQKNPGAAGRPLPPLTQVKIAAEDGTELPRGETGEVWIKSPVVFAGYLNQPEATEKALRPGGWLRTGDLGVMDADGVLTIVDRIKDIIIRGGENISCLEVEAAISAHPKVREAAVFAVPDERMGEIVGAVVVTAPGAGLDQGELAEFLEPRLAGFKIPERWWLQSEPLPRGGTGKTDKRAIRARLLDA